MSYEGQRDRSKPTIRWDAEPYVQDEAATAEEDGWNAVEHTWKSNRMGQ